MAGWLILACLAGGCFVHAACLCAQREQRLSLFYGSIGLLAWAIAVWA